MSKTVNWQDGKLTKAVVSAGDNPIPGPIPVIYNGQKVMLDLTPGKDKTLTTTDFK